MNIVFKGIYSDDIRAFIDIKRRCGYKYRTEEMILHIFDRLTVERGEKVIGISNELAMTWSKKRDNESDAYRYKRSITLNQFALYLSQNGKPSAMSHVPKPKNNFIPYIYTLEETDNILIASDKMKCTPVKVDSIRFIVPALLRFLIGTGVRVGEALDILDEDMNLERNLFILRDTKNGKERLLPFTDSLKEVLAQYKRHRMRLVPCPKSPQFFLSARGRKCTGEQVYKVFRHLLEEAGIPFKGKHNGPYVHHLRHTFAVRSLLQMVRNGMDMYCSLPILSTYLGHQSIEATNNYVRLTMEIYPELMSDIDQNLLVNVFPCLKNDNAYEDD